MGRAVAHRLARTGFAGTRRAARMLRIFAWVPTRIRPIDTCRAALVGRGCSGWGYGRLGRSDQSASSGVVSSRCWRICFSR